MEKLAHVPMLTWKGWSPNDLFGGWFSTLGRFQDLKRGNIPCIRSMPDIALPNPPGTVVLQDQMEASIERKIAAHGMMLWKYKLLDQDDAL
jgi:hypothetical protein